MRIEAKPVWTNTGTRLEARRTYKLVASGEWKDASIPSSPAGYESKNLFQRISERLRRVPSAPWFALVGAIDRDQKTQFVIGLECTYSPPRGGELTCFANDVRGFEFNNSGAIDLQVTTVAGT